MYSTEKEDDSQRLVQGNHTKSVSDFNVLLNSFTDEISNSNMLYHEIFRHVDSIKPFMRVESNIGDQIAKEPRGVIELFQFQLNRLRETNSNLEEIAIHLREIVGD